MKILIIEDNNYKWNDIISSINNTCPDKNFKFTRRVSRNGGLLALNNAYINDEPYDLLILDNQIPLFEDDYSEMLRDGASSILSEIERKGWTIPVCICSSDTMSDDIKSQCVHTIKYNSSVLLDSDFRLVFEKITKE